MLFFIAAAGQYAADRHLQRRCWTFDTNGVANLPAALLSQLLANQCLIGRAAFIRPLAGHLPIRADNLLASLIVLFVRYVDLLLKEGP
ncbi:hypothetical protein D3C80_1906330 [compost metagenome]